MWHFIFYAVVAFFVYQLAISIDWDGAERGATRKVENTAEDAASAVQDSAVGRTVGGALGAVRDLIP